MLDKFQPIKFVKRSYWLTAFFTKSKSILTENVNIINIIDADRIGSDTIYIVFFVFPFFENRYPLNIKFVPIRL